MIKEFKEFISKGNVLDLAVAVVIGAAFAVIVKSFTDDILGQLIAAIGGKPDFANLTLTLRTVTDKSGAQVPVELRYGSFLTAVVNFLIVAFAVFLVVKVANKMQNLRQKEADEKAEVVATELELLTEIRDALVAAAPVGASSSSTTPPAPTA